MMKSCTNNKKETTPEKIKRLSFIKAEDIFFVVYNILIFLDLLECKSKEKAFKDWRKLSFIIYIISDKRKIEILKDIKNGLENRNLSKELKEIYIEGIQNQNLIKHILLLLEKKEIIILEKEKTQINVFLLKSNSTNEFLNNELFENDKININELKKILPKLRILTYKTFLQKVFEDSGVKIWEK